MGIEWSARTCSSRKSALAVMVWVLPVPAAATTAKASSRGACATARCSSLKAGGGGEACCIGLAVLCLHTLPGGVFAQLKSLNDLPTEMTWK